MPLKWFCCPDKKRITVEDCLKDGGCRMGERCASRSFLMMAGKDRPWNGRPSCTQLISGTLHSFLKIKHDYATFPDSRAFMVLGTRGHKVLEDAGSGDDISELELKFQDGDISGIADGIETEKGKRVLYDTKTTGSYKLSKSKIGCSCSSRKAAESGNKATSSGTGRETKSDGLSLATILQTRHSLPGFIVQCFSCFAMCGPERFRFPQKSQVYCHTCRLLIYSPRCGSDGCQGSCLDLSDFF